MLFESQGATTGFDQGYMTKATMQGGLLLGNNRSAHDLPDSEEEFDDPYTIGDHHFI